MAEGRMLKKAISTSRKLAELNTDSARLLYTWLIPFLDVEGRYYGDPDIIKGSIVPRLKTFNSDNIKEYLEEMYEKGLILWYKVDGDRYLQFTCFAKHQNINKDREAKSIIPSPPNNLTFNEDKNEIKSIIKDEVSTLSKSTLPEDTIDKNKEVNISKDEKKNLNNDNFLKLENHFKKISYKDYIKLLSAKIQILDWNDIFVRVLYETKTPCLELLTQHLVLWVYKSKNKITNPLSTLKVINNKVSIGELTTNLLNKSELYEQIDEPYDPIYERWEQERIEREKSPEYQEYCQWYQKEIEKAYSIGKQQIEEQGLRNEDVIACLETMKRYQKKES